ncbi:uncharacterized protein RSE6_08163 [Rhynchosporium secalis]|uniref:Uncharacterized protein n=1 Tax=Rhynchosporium secalis TaxID=38038 RepID=A0A1E1MEQ4_RHYSE|nr:uncharacterized protein RSE6_08163 [Rhynchosporium secalis]
MTFVMHLPSDVCGSAPETPSLLICSFQFFYIRTISKADSCPDIKYRDGLVASKRTTFVRMVMFPKHGHVNGSELPRTIVDRSGHDLETPK